VFGVLSRANAWLMQNTSPKKNIRVVLNVFFIIALFLPFLLLSCYGYDD
jgi:hypothetical protein